MMAAIGFALILSGSLLILSGTVRMISLMLEDEIDNFSIKLIIITISIGLLLIAISFKFAIN